MERGTVLPLRGDSRTGGGGFRHVGGMLRDYITSIGLNIIVYFMVIGGPL